MAIVLAAYIVGSVIVLVGGLVLSILGVATGRVTLDDAFSVAHESLGVAFGITVFYFFVALFYYALTDTLTFIIFTNTGYVFGGSYVLFCLWKFADLVAKDD
jgi:hypothetical protein